MVPLVVSHVRSVEKEVTETLHLTFLFQHWERAEVKVNKPEFNGSRTFNISHYSTKKKKGGLSYSLTPAPPDEILPK